MTKEIYWCELSEDFIDDLEYIEQQIFVDKLLAHQKSQQLSFFKQLCEQLLEAVFLYSTALDPQQFC